MSSFWRGGRNGIIAPILKIGGGDEPSVGSYPALSAIKTYTAKLLWITLLTANQYNAEWHALRSGSNPEIVHYASCYGSIVHRLGLLTVDQVRRVRLPLDPPKTLTANYRFQTESEGSIPSVSST